MIKKAKKVNIIKKDELYKNIDIVKNGIKNNEAYVVTDFFHNKELLNEIKSYLNNIGNSSLPSYYPLEKGIPDYHRIVNNDDRSYVQSIVHQYLFHPWNQNIYDFYNIFKEIYHLKNILSSLKKEKWLINNDYTEFVPRIAFHHYPVGGGYIAKHSDPVSSHQLVVPILQMSKKGKDFRSGGLYAVSESDEKIYIDDLCSIGDLFLFNAEVIHGVDPIDKEKKLDWFDKKGRWMLLCSTIKTSSNIKAPNAIDLEKGML